MAGTPRWKTLLVGLPCLKKPGLAMTPSVGVADVKKAGPAMHSSVAVANVKKAAPAMHSSVGLLCSQRAGLGSKMPQTPCSVPQTRSCRPH